MLKSKIIYGLWHDKGSCGYKEFFETAEQAECELARLGYDSGWFVCSVVVRPKLVEKLLNAKWYFKSKIRKFRKVQ